MKARHEIWRQEYRQRPYLRRTSSANVDPYLSDKGDLDPYICKHFRYSYQMEYRYIWRPPEDTDTLEPIFIEIGSMHDIGEMITLSKRSSIG